MKYIKNRKIILLVILVLIILSAVINFLITNKLNNFYEQINKMEFLGKFTVHFKTVYPAFSIIGSILFPGIFLIFAFIYAYKKNVSSKTFRKWPYIVLIIIFALWTIFMLYRGINSGFKDSIKLERSKMVGNNIPGKIIFGLGGNMTDKEFLTIQNQVNKIYVDDYFSTIKLLHIINLILTAITLATSIYLLVLTNQIKNSANNKYSQEVKTFKQKNKLKKENNDLP